MSEFRSVRYYEDETKAYTVYENGVVIRTNVKTGEECVCEPWFYRGIAFAPKINGEAQMWLKTLVARHFMDGWQPHDQIVHIDGNPRSDCAYRRKPAKLRHKEPAP
jgi:hypothetical protein